MSLWRKKTINNIPQVSSPHPHHHDPILVDTVIWVSNEVTDISLHKKAINLASKLVVVFVFVETLGQLFYPVNRALPRTQVNGQHFGFESVQSIAKELNDNQMTLQLKAGSLLPAPASAAKMGMDTDSLATARKLASYPLVHRVVPFSIFFGKGLESSIKRVDEQKLTAYLPKLQEQFSAQPTDAAITIEGDKVVIAREQDGWQLDSPAAFSNIKLAASEGKAQVALPTKPLVAHIKATDLEQLRTTAEKLLAKKLIVTTSAGKHEVPAGEIAKWVVFDTINTPIRVNVGDIQIAEYLSGLKSEVESKTISAKAQVIDNKVQITEPGKPGVTLDIPKTVETVKAALNSDQAAAEINVATLQSATPTVYNYTYSATNEGLNALLANSIKGRGGRFSIGAQALSGNDGRYGLVNDNSFVIASIYKLFIAQVLFERLGNSSLSWSSTLNTGQSVGECFDRMIVVSDNRCAIAIGQEIGWSSLDTILRSEGYGHTRLNNYNSDGTFNGNKTSSSSDILLLLRRLHDGSFAKPEYNQVLLGAMKRQIYRKGIPAGTNSVVADKVGFIDSYINDAGIIFGNTTQYSLVILSSGSSWSNIAAITKQVDTYFGN